MHREMEKTTLNVAKSLRVSKFSGNCFRLYVIRPTLNSATTELSFLIVT